MGRSRRVMSGIQPLARDWSPAEITRALIAVAKAKGDMAEVARLQIAVKGQVAARVTRRRHDRAVRESRWP